MLRNFILLIVYMLLPLSATAVESEQNFPPDTASVMQKSLVHYAENGKQSVAEAVRHWKRKSTLNTCAWITAGTGCTAMLVGLIGGILDNPYTNASYSAQNSRSWNAVIFSGAGVMAASVPLFVIARAEKKKALNYCNDPEVLESAKYDYSTESFKMTKHWKRHKRYKVWAWTLFSIGAGATMTGLIGNYIDKSTNVNYKRSNSESWHSVLYPGLVVTAVSVPFIVKFFTTGHKARKSVTSVSLGATSIPVYLTNGAAVSSPALGLSLNFCVKI